MGRTKWVAFYISPLKAKEGKDWALSCLWDAKQLLREHLSLLSALETLVPHVENHLSTDGWEERQNQSEHNELNEAGRTPMARLPNVLRDGKKYHGQPTKQSAGKYAGVDGTMAYQPKGTVASFWVVVRRIIT